MSREIPGLAPHPLVDAGGDGWLLWESRSPVVSLTPAAVNLLARSLEQKVVPILVTDATSVLTAPFAETWRTAGAGWVVRGRDGMREGFSGRRLDEAVDVLTASPVRSADDVDLAFLEPRPATALELSVILSQRHRPTRAVSLGGAVDALAGAIGTVATAWGTHEPTGARWDRAAFTEYARVRMPEDSLVVVTGPRVVATVAVRRTKPGIEEITTLTADLGAPTTPDFARMLDSIDDALRELAAGGIPLIGWVAARPAATPMTVPAVLQAPPTPLRLLIGPPGVKVLGLKPAVLSERFAAETVGRPRLPGVLFRLGTLGEPTWERLDEILSTMDRRLLDEALGTAVPTLGGDRGVQP